MKVNTIGDLKKAIKDMDDNIKIINYKSDMEKSGYMEGIYLQSKKCKKERKETYDRFDYTNYSYEVFVENKSGEECLSIS